MTQDTTLPIYQSVIETLCCQSLPALPAELHGYLCGLICGSHQNTPQKLYQFIFDTLKQEELLTDENKNLIATLVNNSHQQLKSPDFSFQLLLPDDKKPLKTRIEALVKWAQSFLSGLGIAGFDQADLKNKDSAEAIHDIIEITKINFNNIGLKIEEAEESYVEITEHLRISVILLYTENTKNLH